MGSPPPTSFQGFDKILEQQREQQQHDLARLQEMWAQVYDEEVAKEAPR